MWSASSPTGCRRGAWWARLAEQHGVGEARRYLTIPNAAGNEALPEPNLDAAAFHFYTT